MNQGLTIHIAFLHIFFLVELYLFQQNLKLYLLILLAYLYSTIHIPCNFHDLFFDAKLFLSIIIFFK